MNGNFHNDEPFIKTVNADRIKCMHTVLSSSLLRDTILEVMERNIKNCRDDDPREFHHSAFC